ncbi:hypothetical protein CHS0354_033188 [Potamilus streckersoni]|uniref:Uncharacterized protein n=1 Tax=Potamilus streckersoni TaxID=2493646 RepID=A0AAE0VR23_9BIVA|nr:hypothetical protein CHS0354_033188 [Potamilus streckersoni]
MFFTLEIKLKLINTSRYFTNIIFNIKFFISKIQPCKFLSISGKCQKFCESWMMNIKVFANLNLYMVTMIKVLQHQVLYGNNHQGVAALGIIWQQSSKCCSIRYYKATIIKVLKHQVLYGDNDQGVAASGIIW